MNKNILLVFAFIILGQTYLLAQPRVTNIDPENTFTNGEVVISGSGFGTNINDLVVWFGAVRAKGIVSTTDNTLKVLVPEGAENAPITVERISTGLLGESKEYFYLSHSGESFNIAQLSAATKFLNGSVELFDICGCDFDNDGLSDLATTETTGTQVTILKNSSSIGTINFTPQLLNTVTPNTGIGCGDLDGDGKKDLFMTRAGSNRNQIYIYKNTSAGPGSITFGPQIALNLLTNNPNTNPYQAVKVVHGDMNGDGKPELVVTNGNGSERLLNILVNTSSIGTISFSAANIIPLPEMTSNSGISLNDVDNDGNLDLILTRTLSADVYIYRSTGGTGLSFESPFIVSTNSQAITNVNAIDLNNDGLKEIITTEVFSTETLIYENLSTPGNLSFSASKNFGVGLEPWTVKGVDIDGNGLLDLVVGNRNETSYSILTNTGGLNFNSASNTIEQATRNIYAGDLDGDGKPDLAFTSLQLPTGSFSIQTVRNTNCYTPEFLNIAPIALCPGQNVTLEVPDATGVTFSWKKDAVDLGLSTASIVASAAGLYEVRAVSEGGSCDITASFTVNNGAGTVPTAPIATNDGPSCAGQSVNLSVNSQAGASYFWEGPDGFTSTSQNPVISNITQNQAGFYTVLVKVGDCLSSEAQTEVIVNAVESFSISTSDPTTACAGSTVNLTTQNRAGFTYSWLKNGASTGSTGTAFAASSAGTYSVAVTDNNTNCTVTSNEIVVSILSAPVASFTVSGTICTGIDAVFTNTSTVDPAATPVYTWDFGDGTVINSIDATHIYTTANNFNVSLNIEYSGITCANSNSQSIAVTQAAPVTITSATSVICDATPIDLSASGTFASLSWSSGETVANISVDVPNTYTVTATDNNGCISTDQIDIIDGIVPTLTILGNNTASPLTVSSGTAVQFIADGADSYVWSPSDFLSDPNINNPVSTPNSNITYTIVGALIDGCSSTAEFTIAIQAVLEDINITPAKAFAPDNVEDQFWQIGLVENYPDCSLSIFDERGSLVFREIGYNNTWDGTNAGSPLPEGVYYYVFSCPSLKPKTGTVLLIRF